MLAKDAEFATGSKGRRSPAAGHLWLPKDMALCQENAGSGDHRFWYFFLLANRVIGVPFFDP